MRTLQEQSSLSVIVPALNAAETLPQLLAGLCPQPLVGEIIVADGGSVDRTTALAEARGARVVTAPRGRGTQLAAGAGAASGHWLLFLHADCRPEPGWSRAVSAFINAPQAEGRAGYFDFALDDAAAVARRLERTVAWRCRVLALPYGDQGLLISRALYDEVGGFAPLPLMEDVDLARRLGRRRLARIGVGCLASARRYRQDGYWRRSLRNLVCLSLYFAGLPPRRIMRLYR
ncbi:MAG TPA: TIGR04283 family arsenosugar biosynthesis glycosyltransferase [Stellaceae bacterium]|jgi:rSAM/selenodomain-associated transferase 2|nr:TIGR04283 family arsenosugar biosynthesis glycosyltransferase [Stellaceae bacterium]